MKHFAISYDPFQTANLAPQFMAFISAFRHSYSWSKPYEGLYFIKSFSEKEQIAADINLFFNKSIQFIVTEVGAAQTFAVVNGAIWDWFHSDISAAPNALPEN